MGDSHRDRVSSLWLLSPFLPGSDSANAGVWATCAALRVLLPDLDASESKIKHLGLSGLQPFSLPAARQIQSSWKKPFRN